MDLVSSLVERVRRAMSSTAAAAARALEAHHHAEPEPEVLTIDESGWLRGPGVERLPSVRHSPMAGRGSDGHPVPLGVVWHYTGGVGGDGFARELARRIQAYREGVDREASWHCVIARDGSIIQSVSFEQGAWHVSLASLHKAGLQAKIGRFTVGSINRTTIGIELENAGRLKAAQDGRFYAWPYFRAGTRIPDKRLLVASERALRVPGAGYYDAFPGAQVAAARRLLAVLVTHYRLERDACAAGHVHYDPTRREDPGPLWLGEVLPQVLRDLFGGKAEVPERIASELDETKPGRPPR